MDKAQSALAVAIAGQSALASGANDSALMQDFHGLCALGGRLAGTASEERAQEWLLQRVRSISSDVKRHPMPYDGWRCKTHSLQLFDAGAKGPRELHCHPLLRSANTPAAGLDGEIVDVGDGHPEDFARAGRRLRGRMALVRHEYPFLPRHVHRRRKYNMALEAGAIGFLIANPLPGGGVLSGSSGRPAGGFGIPAAYIGDADCTAIVQAGQHGLARVRLHIDGEDLPDARAGVTVLDLPGATENRIVISAHLDGHDLGQSALDNASGVCVVLAAARALAPRMASATHGLRVCIFSAEEWALAGSARYVGDMDAVERASLALNINLDTVAGDDHFTALISDFPQLAEFTAQAGRDAGAPLACHLPLMPNSDHASFAAHGIPALRLLAGFDRADSRVRHILSADDQAGVVLEHELRQALRLTVAMAWRGLTMPAAELAALRRRTDDKTV